MIKLPDLVCKKVGSTNLFRVYLQENHGNCLLKSFDRFYAKYKTLDLRCDSDQFQHEYSLEDVTCPSCGIEELLSIVYKEKTKFGETIGLGKPRIFCQKCKNITRVPQDLDLKCSKHKEEKKLTYFLIGNNNTELELIMTLMVADLENEIWYTTQYFQAFNSEETNALGALNYLVSNRKLSRPKSFEAKTLDISPFNRKNNLYKITESGRNYYQTWLEESGLGHYLPDFIKHRESELFSKIKTISAKKGYSVRKSKFEMPSEEEHLQVAAKHITKPNVEEIWEKDYEKYWSWRFRGNGLF